MGQNRITSSDSIYIDGKRVGRIVIRQEQPHFKQNLKYDLDPRDLEKIAKLIDKKFYI